MESELIRLSSKEFEEMNVDELYSMRYLIIMLVEAIIAICTSIAMEAYAMNPLLTETTLIASAEERG